jgi:hypothetical protein
VKHKTAIARRALSTLERLATRRSGNVLIVISISSVLAADRGHNAAEPEKWL